MQFVIGEADRAEERAASAKAVTPVPAFAEMIMCVVSRADCDQATGPHSRAEIAPSATLDRLFHDRPIRGPAQSASEPVGDAISAPAQSPQAE